MPLTLSHFVKHYRHWPEALKTLGGAVFLLLMAACGTSQLPEIPANDATLSTNAESRVIAIPRDGESAFRVLAVDGEKRIVAGGARLLPDQSRWLMQVARFLYDGSLDTGFGDDGVVEFLAPGRNYGFTYDVIVDSQSRIVACGAWFTPTPDLSETLEASATLVRFTPDGQVDSSFGMGGVAELPPAILGHNTRCRGVREVNGSYYIVGVNQPGGPGLPIGIANPPELVGILSRPVSEYAFLAKFDEQGRYDPTFGVLGASQVHSYYLTHPTLDVDGMGRLYVSYQAFDTAEYNNDVFVSRYLPSGNLDQTYGDGGRVLLEKGVKGDSSFVGSHGGFAFDIVVAADGTSWHAGLKHSIPQLHVHKQDPVLWRVTPEGIPDRVFEQVTMSALASSVNRNLTGLSRDEHGFLTALMVQLNMGVFNLVRFSPSGALDRTFGDSGVSPSLQIFGLDLIGAGETIVVGGGLAIINGDSVRFVSALEFVEQ